MNKKTNYICDDSGIYTCSLCNYSTKIKSSIAIHNKSKKHQANFEKNITKPEKKQVTKHKNTTNIEDKNTDIKKNKDIKENKNSINLQNKHPKKDTLQKNNVLNNDSRQNKNDKFTNVINRIHKETYEYIDNFMYEVITKESIQIEKNLKNSADLNLNFITKTLDDSKYICSGCKKTFDDINDYKTHEQTCNSAMTNYKKLIVLTSKIIVQLNHFVQVDQSKASELFRIYENTETPEPIENTEIINQDKVAPSDKIKCQKLERQNRELYDEICKLQSKKSFLDARYQSLQKKYGTMENKCEYYMRRDMISQEEIEVLKNKYVTAKRQHYELEKRLRNCNNLDNDNLNNNNTNFNIVYCSKPPNTCDHVDAKKFKIEDNDVPMFLDYVAKIFKDVGLPPLLNEKDGTLSSDFTSKIMNAVGMSNQESPNDLGFIGNYSNNMNMDGSDCEDDENSENSNGSDTIVTRNNNAISVSDSDSDCSSDIIMTKNNDVLFNSGDEDEDEDDEDDEDDNEDDEDDENDEDEDDNDEDEDDDNKKIIHSATKMKKK